MLLAYYVALHANQTTSLADELAHQIENMIAVLGAAERDGETVRAFNPMCREDELTDRWPCDRNEQRIFIDELTIFAGKLNRLRQDIGLSETQKILEELFGERPARTAIEKYVERYADEMRKGGGTYLTGTASIPAAAAVVPTTAKVAPPHKFFGDAR